MHSLSQYALAASIFASVMGALVMCVLVFRYGFTVPAPSDAEAGPTPTDVLITRVGHAVAGVCFAATAVLAIVGLSLRAPAGQVLSPTAVVPTPVAAVAPAEGAGGGRASRLEGDVGALEQRLAEAELQLARLDLEIRNTSARAAALEPRDPVTRREVPAPSRPSAVAAPVSVVASGARPPAASPPTAAEDPEAAVSAPPPPGPAMAFPPTPSRVAAVSSTASSPPAVTPAPTPPPPGVAPVPPPPREAAVSPPASPSAGVSDRPSGFLATAREEWNANRQRASELVNDVRAALTRAERQVVRYLGNDPRGRVSPRD